MFVSFYIPVDVLYVIQCYSTGIEWAYWLFIIRDAMLTQKNMDEYIPTIQPKYCIERVAACGSKSS